MKAELPILQRIHDKFDVYPKCGDTEHSIIRNIDISSTENGYYIKTYPGGRNSIYDGFVLDVDANGGIFGNEGPRRVETSRDYGGTMILYAETGFLSEPAAEEGLILPGDEGFELFEELHEKLQILQPALEDAVRSVYPRGLKPETLLYEHMREGTYYDKEDRVIRDSATTIWKIKEKTGIRKVHVELDGTREFPYDFSQPIDNFRLPEEVVYRAGEALVWHRRPQHVTHDAIHGIDKSGLISFERVHREVKKLYESNSAE